MNASEAEICHSASRFAYAPKTVNTFGATNIKLNAALSGCHSNEIVKVMLTSEKGK